MEKCTGIDWRSRSGPVRAVALVFGLLASMAIESRAATIVPPVNLGDLGRRAGAVVLATAMSAEPVQRGALIFTNTRFVVADALSGPVSDGEELLVEAPGGEIGGLGWMVAGSPRFEVGATYLLFLNPGRDGRWQPTVMSWGIMRRIETEALGNVLVPVQEEDRLSALPRKDGVVPEPPAPASEAPLVEHLRSVIGRRAEWNAEAFSVPRWLLPGGGGLDSLAPPAGCAFMSAPSGNLRWRAFDTGGSVTMSAALPGDSSISGGGFSQVQGALSAWEGISATSMSLTYGGQVSYSLTCTGGEDYPGSSSRVIVFNDPCADIAELSGCSGTLAFGGPWYSGTHSFDGTTWSSIISWFVVINNGAGCLGSTDYQRMLTHELGHGLGFDHVADSSALMYFMCCNSINTTDRTCAQYVYPSATPPPAPVAGFNFSPASPVAGQTVSFTDTSTNTPTSWAWSFGDPASGGANSSTLRNPTHAFASAAAYTVTLTATNAGGSDGVSRQVTVAVPPAPTANFTYSPSSPAVGQNVQFTDTSTGSPTSWAWDFGDGGTSTTRHPVHAFSSSATFTVTLVATNTSGSSQKQRTVTVSQPSPPVAAFAFSPLSPVVGQQVSFVDQSTGVPTSRLWTFGDGTSSTSANPVKTYPVAGTYTVTLQVSNSFGSNSTSKAVVVSPAGSAPVASFTFSPDSPQPGQAVQYTDTSTGGPTRWSWDFGDGTFSADQNPVKTYASAGTLSVRLFVENAFGSSTTTRSITIASTANQPPVAAADAYVVFTGATLTVNPPGVLGNDSDPDGDALTALLVSPPGKGTFGLQPSGGFVYAPSAGFTGTDSFSYRAVDARGSPSDPAFVTITVSGVESERVVPIVLDAYGEGTSHFRSELVLANRGTTPATVELTYTAATALGASGSGTVTESLDRGRQLVLDDALAYLRTRGLLIPKAVAGASQGGTLRARFRGLSSPDAGAAFARTTALLPQGRAGVAYPALAPTDWAAVPAQNVFGLRETGQERSNLAMANLGSTGDVGLRVTLYSGSRSDPRTFVLPETIWLRPLQWTQLGSVLARAGFTNGWALVERVSGTEPFYAYGVFNDYGTNDGSFIDPIPVASTETTRTVPVVLELGIYTTELILANPTASDIDVSLRYVESYPVGGAGVARRVGTDFLRAREQKVVEAIPHLRGLGVDVGAAGGSYAGSIVATFTASGLPATGFAGARTKSPGQPQGFYGVYYSGLGAGQAAPSEAWVFGLKQDGDSRTNVAIVHAEPGGAPLTLQAEIFDGETGASVGRTGNVELTPGEWFQWNQILDSFGLRQGYARVLRVTGSSPFLAYAVVNDGGSSRAGTNDGSYVPMLPGR